MGSGVGSSAGPMRGTAVLARPRSVSASGMDQSPGCLVFWFVARG